MRIPCLLLRPALLLFLLLLIAACQAAQTRPDKVIVATLAPTAVAAGASATPPPPPPQSRREAQPNPPHPLRRRLPPPPHAKRAPTKSRPSGSPAPRWKATCSAMPPAATPPCCSRPATRTRTRATPSSTCSTAMGATKATATTCSMGADGAIQLALKYPGIFSVAAPMSARYDWYDPAWLAQTAQGLDAVLATFAAPLLPHALRPGRRQGRRGAGLCRAAAHQHPSLPRRRRQHRHVDFARAFDRKLSEAGVTHTCVELPAGGHCPGDMDAVWQFLSGNLAFAPAD